MTDTRTILCGMNNPHSDEDRHALAPYPRGVAGHRLFTMLSEHRNDITRVRYMSGFDRRNILPGRSWSLPAARAGAASLWQTWGDRRAVLLGREVLPALRLPQAAPLVWQRRESTLLDEPGPDMWCYMPHPSGLNHWYNDPWHRLAVALFLEEEFERGCQGRDPVT